MINLKNNYSLIATRDIRNICDSFLKKFNLSYFLYAKHYNDKSRLNLSNMDDWIEHYFKNGYQNFAKLERHSSCYKNSYTIWDHCNNDCLSKKIVEKDSATNFDISHVLSFTVNNQNHYDIFLFGTKPCNESINQFYLTNINLFENFCLYFMHQAKPIIRQADQQRFLVKHLDKFDYYQEYSDVLCNTSNLEILNFHQKPLVTKRELECIKWLLKGKTNFEIALILGASARTVEKHIASIKDKLHCQTMFQLGNKSTALGLDKLSELY